LVVSHTFPDTPSGIAEARQGSLFGDAYTLGYDGGPVFDEMVSGEGRLRPHWQALLRSLGPLAPEVMDERWEEARRLLRQNGVTYNIHGDPQGMERPWPLDMVPLIIPAEEWRVIEDGLVQRATLLNAVLADLYGPQTLLRDGLVPPAALYADPAFQRAVHGIPLPGGVHLHFYAADLARAADGRWWVLSDRTQAPSGSGYALENRAVLTRVLPDALRQCAVERLAPFFTAFRDALLALAPRAGRPRLVLLTPGPYNETYFEHVYLARQLGITLVEGEDLTVRDRQVFLKTLSGLEPVHVILRRLDEDYADPLGLRADSSLGVAGLVEAVRAGTVVVANALGSGLMESPALRPFLPTICRHLTGRDLTLPDRPVWWCGQPEERRHVLANLDRLVVAPAHRAPGVEPVFGGALSAAARDELAARVERTPWAFVGQERPSLSTAPVWQDDRLQPRPLVLRVFLCATPGGYVAMPGGLTRVSAEAGRLAVSIQQGGGSKDTWVLAAGRTAGAGHHARGTDHRPPDSRPALTGDLPSRVADGLYWFGRYAERCEGTVRLLRAAVCRLTDASQPGAAEELRVLLRLHAWMGMVPHELASVADSTTPRALRTALHAAVFDAAHPNSLRANVQRLHRAAASVRDRLSLDLWRVVAQADRQCRPPDGRVDAATLQLILDDVVTTLAALAGLEQESMPRGPGWRFLDMGRRMERAVHGIGLLRGVGIAEPGRLAGTEMEAALDVLLELAESVMTYRERHFGDVEPAAVLELLLADETNPRALAFQLAALHQHLFNLPRGPDAGIGAALAIVASARATLKNPDTTSPGPALHGALEGLSGNLPEISNLLAHACFSHAFARPA